MSGHESHSSDDDERSCEAGRFCGRATGIEVSVSEAVTLASESVVTELVLGGQVYVFRADSWLGGSRRWERPDGTTADRRVEVSHETTVEEGDVEVLDEYVSGSGYTTRDAWVEAIGDRYESETVPPAGNVYAVAFAE
jgi:hypothetical protein